jgi:hypothetical protein
MDEEKKNLPEENQEVKTPWQTTKEGWYDKVPLTVKQLDTIIVAGFVALAVVFGLIFLVLMVCSSFGYNYNAADRCHIGLRRTFCPSLIMCILSCRPLN